jgi:hypothetical protein
MIIHKAITLRPTLEVNFFIPPKDLQDLRADYIAEGKILKQEMTLSEDQLTRTVVTNFVNEEVFLDYIFGKTVKDTFSIRMLYNERNQIVEVLSMSDQNGKPYYLHSRD